MAVREKISGKPDEKTIDRVLLVCCILAAGLMLARCFFGIEITDEAYYVADAINALRGNYPFAYNFNSAAGMNLITAPLVALYRCFVPDLAGVFLFTRITFTLFRLGLLTAVYFILGNKHKKWARLLAILFMTGFNGAIVSNWSYNTIPVWLVFFTGVLLGTALEEGSTGRVYISAAVSGILISLAELIHPLNFLTVIFMGAAILVFSPAGARIKAAALYAAGGILNAVAVLGVIAAKAGPGRLLNGLEKILTTGGKAAGKSGSLKWLGSWFAYRYLWMLMAIAAASFVLLYFILKKKKGGPIDPGYALKLAASLLILGSMLGLLGLLCRRVSVMEMYMLGAAALVPLLCMICLRIKSPLFYLLFPPQLLFCLTEIRMTNNSDPIGRFYYLIPIYFVLFILLLESDRRSVRYTASAACVAGACLMISFAYVYVYRDVPLSQMDYRMPSGIYRGICTEAQKGRDTVQLESYIHEITDEGEWVKFCDNAPVGYLFHDGKMCDIRAWDAMNYTYRKNNPKKMYQYFAAREAIPDKLIYIDFKRDEQLSIEDDDWKFNDFVHTFYEFSEERVLNSTYRVKIYLRAGEYDDFLEWSADRR